jgi:hypothetical protein
VIKQIIGLLLVSGLLMSCAAAHDQSCRDDEKCIGIYSISATTTPNELEYLKWLYRSYLEPELQPQYDGPSTSHYFVHIELDDTIRQVISKPDGVEQAKREGLSGNVIRGYGLTETEHQLRLTYSYSWAVTKVAASSVMAKSEVDPVVWAGDPICEPFITVVEACAATYAILQAYNSPDKRIAKDAWTSSVQSYLLVAGYVDGVRCLCVMPMPYYEHTWYHTPNEVEALAAQVMQNGDAHFTALHRD